MVLFVVANINKRIEDAINMIKSIIWKLTGVIVPYMAIGISKTTHILKILLPIIVSPINILDTLKFWFVDEAPSTKKSVPFIKRPKPNNKRIIFIINFITSLP